MIPFNQTFLQPCFMKRLFFFLPAFICALAATAQSVGIGTVNPQASAALEVRSANKGFLLPRISLAHDSDASTVSSPFPSLLIFNTNNALPYGEGFYFWTGSKWNRFATRNNIDNFTWKLDGNSGTNAAADFIGTTDNTPLVFKTGGLLSGKIDPTEDNVFLGQSAGNTTGTGSDNSFFGNDAGRFFTTGSYNLLAGSQAGYQTNSGSRNVLLGHQAGYDNESGERNVLIGDAAGKYATGNSKNTAIGAEALGNTASTHTDYNVAVGYRAGYNSAVPTAVVFPDTLKGGIYIGAGAGYNAQGGIAIGANASYNFSDYRNIAIGHNALKLNLTGVLDIAIGFETLKNNTNGQYNLAIGPFTMAGNTTGDYNLALGNNALYNNTIGDNNVAVGSQALSNNTSGINNTAVGVGADFSGAISSLNNATVIGYNALVATSNTQVFGNGSVDRWAFGITTTTAQHALEVGSTAGNGNGAYLTQGGNWTNTCDANKKENFSPLNRPELLQKISSLTIQRWKYKGTEEYHIGPAAQEFYAAFNVGVDDKGISTVDPSGIALAAIQELIKENEALKQRIEKLEAIILKKQAP